MPPGVISYPAAAGVGASGDIFGMTQDFTDDLIEACEKEGKKCLVLILEGDFSGAMVSSVGIEGENLEDNIIKAIETAFLL